MHDANEKLNLTNLIQSQPYSYELIVLSVHKKVKKMMTNIWHTNYS